MVCLPCHAQRFLPDSQLRIETGIVCALEARAAGNRRGRDWTRCYRRADRCGRWRGNRPCRRTAFSSVNKTGICRFHLHQAISKKYIFSGWSQVFGRAVEALLHLIGRTARAGLPNRGDRARNIRRRERSTVRNGARVIGLESDSATYRVIGQVGSQLL
jgi:hypothetical protein